jgi:hypothetical protein
MPRTIRKLFAWIFLVAVLAFVGRQFGFNDFILPKVAARAFAAPFYPWYVLCGAEQFYESPMLPAEDCAICVFFVSCIVGLVASVILGVIAFLLIANVFCLIAGVKPPWETE